MSTTLIGAAGEDDRNNFGSSGIAGGGGAEQPLIWQPKDQRPDGGTFKMPTLNNMIVHTQLTTNWPHGDELAWLRSWEIGLINEMDIRVHGGDRLSPPLISIERMNIKTVGHFVPDANGLGIAGIIRINKMLLPPVIPRRMTLTFLFKFLLDACEEEAAGRDQNSADWHPDDSGRDIKGRDLKARHDWRAKMKKSGVIIDKKGGIKIDSDGAFGALLAHYGYFGPNQVITPRPPQDPKSTLKLWSCRCQKAYIGKKVYIAHCPECNADFQIGDHVGTGKPVDDGTSG